MAELTAEKLGLDSQLSSSWDNNNGKLVNLNWEELD